MLIDFVFDLSVIPVEMQLQAANYIICAVCMSVYSTLCGYAYVCVGGPSNKHC